MCKVIRKSFGISERARFTGRVAYRRPFGRAAARRRRRGLAHQMWGADRNRDLLVTAARDEVYSSPAPERADGSRRVVVGEAMSASCGRPSRAPSDVAAVLAAAPRC